MIWQENVFISQLFTEIIGKETCNRYISFFRRVTGMYQVMRTSIFGICLHKLYAIWW